MAIHLLYVGLPWAYPGTALGLLLAECGMFQLLSIGCHCTLAIAISTCGVSCSTILMYMYLHKDIYTVNIHRMMFTVQLLTYTPLHSSFIMTLVLLYCCVNMNKDCSQFMKMSDSERASQPVARISKQCHAWNIHQREQCFLIR